MNHLLEDKIKRCLAALGNTEATVTRRLRRLGIQGQRGRATCCPVANYLKKHLRRQQGIYIRPYGAHVHHRQRGWLFVGLPDAVQQFIKRFDTGHHPCLQEKEHHVRLRALNQR